jgi:NFACT protein RNA binding domain
MVFYFRTRCGNYLLYMGKDKYENEDLIKYGQVRLSPATCVCLCDCHVSRAPERLVVSWEEEPSRLSSQFNAACFALLCFALLLPCLFAIRSSRRTCGSTSTT